MAKKKYTHSSKKKFILKKDSSPLGDSKHNNITWQNTHYKMYIKHKQKKLE